MTTAPAPVRVPMVRPARATVARGVCDLRADPLGSAELIDQVHYGEVLSVLGAKDAWSWVQAEDHYFGWIASGSLGPVPGAPGGIVVAVPLADVRQRAEESAPVVDRHPVGTLLTGATPQGRWLRLREGTFVAAADTVARGELPERAPTVADVLATAEAFLGIPYLWGGTSATGLDCSGFVQQVYRLNGVGLDRDADQQALEGRAVDRPRAGDLVFYGQDEVTHVGLATSEGEMLHAPMQGAFVERRALSDRYAAPRAIRRMLVP